MRQIIQFLQEVRHEFYNITWPKKEALIQLTFVVISISIIISLILGGFDYIFTQSIALLGRPKTNTVTQPVITPASQITPTVTVQITPTVTNLKK